MTCRITDSESSSTSGENNNLESGKTEEEEEEKGKEEVRKSAVKPPTKKTESWPRFSYTGSLGGTLQVESDISPNVAKKSVLREAIL